MLYEVITNHPCRQYGTGSTIYYDTTCCEKVVVGSLHVRQDLTCNAVLDLANLQRLNLHFDIGARSAVGGGGDNDVGTACGVIGDVVECNAARGDDAKVGKLPAQGCNGGF